MLTVVDPSGRRAGIQAVLMAMALLPVSMAPGLTTSMALFYVVAVVALGVGQLICSIQFLLHKDETSARRLLRASLIYLPALLVLLILLPLA
jgi:protoheme IX farnesyltransferase